MFDRAGSLVSLLGRELLTRPRQKWFYLVRTGIVLVTVVILGFVLEGASGYRRNATLGLDIFRTITLAMTVVVYLVAPIWGSQGMITEKEQRTLTVLWLTDFQPSMIVVSKLLSSMWMALTACLVLVPLVLICVSLGGISSEQILLAFAVLGSLVVLGSSIGLVAGTLSRHERQSRFILGMLTIGIFVVLPIFVMMVMDGLERNGFVERSLDLDRLLTTSCNSLLSMISVIDGGSLYGGALYNVGFNLGLGLVLTVISGVGLPWMLNADERPTLGERLKLLLKGTKGVKAGRYPKAWGNAVFWKDYNVDYGGMQKNVVKIMLIVVGLWLLLWVCFAWMDRGFRDVFSLGALWEALFDDDMWEVQFVGLLTVSFSAIAWISLSLCSRAFVRERRARAVEVLLTTTMTPEQIVLGKALAIVAYLVPWLAMAATGMLIILIHALPIRLRDIKELAMIWSYIGSMWAGYSCLAMYFSSRFKKNVGFFLCLLIGIGGHIIVPSLLFGVMRGLFGFRYSGEAVATLGVVLHLGMAVGAGFLLITGLRRNLMR